MTASTSPTKPHHARQAPSSSALLDSSHDQVATAVEMGCAVLRGFEAIRKIQRDAAHQGIVRHEALARKLRDGTHSADMLTLESEVLLADLQSASRYWQDLAGAALEMQTEVLTCAGNLVSNSAPVLEGATASRSLGQIPGFRFWLSHATPPPSSAE